jgi:hypothetical protein
MGERATSRRLVAAASLASALAFALTLLAILPIAPALLVTGIVAWFSLPGVLFLRRAAPRDAGWFFPIVIGSIWGYAASCLVLLALWVAGVRNTVILLAVPPLVAAGVLVPIGPRVQLTLPRLDRRDVPALLLLLLLVPLVVGRPFARVGELAPDGRTYRAYFTADFIWRMAVTAEVAKGDVPPKNQFFRGDDLRYYWLPDLLSAVEYRALGKRLRLEQTLLANAVAIDAMFVAFLYGFVRHWSSSPLAAAIGASAAVLFGSFEGTERIIAFAREGLDYGYLRMLNIDAITRWVYGSLPVDGLQRVLFWQPQHAAGYMLGFSALLVVSQPIETLRPRQLALAGALLAAMLFFSSVSAIMLGAIVAVVAAGRLAVARQWRTIVVGGALAALPVAIALAAVLGLHYVDRGESLLRVLVNPAAVTHPWVSIFLSFGAMLPAAAAGTWLAVRSGGVRLLWPLWATIVISFLFYFFVDVRDHQYVYVGWRAGHLLFIVFAALAAVGIQGIGRLSPVSRRVAMAAAVLLAAAAAPTVAIDIYNAQDTSNRAPGPRFEWTLVLSPDELTALDWIRRYTPPGAVVQVEPHVRDAHTWAYIPSFAERRMAAGIPISMVPLDKYLSASERVRELYRSTDARNAHRQAIELGIDYVVVGGPERAAYPGFERALDGPPEGFRPVFRNGSMTIYFVERDRPGVAGRR